MPQCMPEVVVVEVPEDVREEFGKVPEKNWQLLFSRFLRSELEGIKRAESITSKSRMSRKQADKLADEVSLAVSKRLLSPKEKGKK